jgi:hypothetical protein
MNEILIEAFRHEGLRLLLAGGSPESQNASGGTVRPVIAGASR